MDVLERLQKLKAQYHMSDYRIAKKAGLAQGTVSNIFKRNTIPSILTLEAICNGLGLTLSQFFADDDLIELTPDLKELFAYWVRLSEEKKDIVLKMIKALV